MIRKPKFKTHLEVRVVPPDLLVFADEIESSGLKGELFPLLAPLIDGTRTVAELADALGDHNIAHVHHALTLLEECDYVVDADAQPPRYRPPPSGRPALELSPHVRQVGIPRVRVSSICDLDTGPLEAILEARQISTRGRGEFRIVITADYQSEQLRQINRSALKTGVPWMPVRPVRSRTWIGPIIVPGKTACWTCLAIRLRQNHAVADFATLHGGNPSPLKSPESTVDPSVVETTYEIAADAIANRSKLDGLVVFDPANSSIERHAVVRLPHCPDCGRSGPVTARPVTLESCRRLQESDGGYRALAPEETVAGLMSHVSPLTGIVHDIRTLQEDPMVHVYSAGFCFPPGLRDRGFLDKNLLNWATGKGATAEQSRASALAEALERHSGVYTGREPRVRSSFQELGAAAIHPNESMLFSGDQFAGRETSNAIGSNWIPELFDPTRPVDWSPLWSMTHRSVRYLPTACCYYGCPCPRDHDFGRADSNGNAAGNTLEEAILQGFLELVERDAVALWWYNRVPRPEVDLAAFDRPYFTGLRETYRSLGRRIWVLDVTTDFGIATFVAVSMPEDRDDGRDVLLGFGSHLDPAIAASRALTEMNQFLPSALRGQVRRVTDGELDDLTFLLPAPRAQPWADAEFPGADRDDLRAAVEACVALAWDRGIEVLVLEQTREEIGLPVVKVVAPGLRPFWARFAPGRLFSVPLHLEWRSEPVSEPEMNPAHLAI